ncbi:topoisomerase (DNA) I, gene 2 [Xenopus tropicalis]|uniref:DNA topoisomerase I n=2 Tax=Xenopus tropicalis TaxID=8364 RepID=A0A8J0QGH0_XENTR|nr:topoisomerase (DNA) I, gene 2 [Xenopus tropicalis]|eukprot:XP_017948441.1 PREDICTED: topoisomerase (DNA) I, gene 2 isoform X1 [Xenopus tropicalis]
MTQLSLPVEDLVSFHNLPEKARDKKKKLKSEPKPEGKAKKKDKGKAAVQDGETQRQRGKENNMPVAEEREIKSDKRKEKKKKDSKKKKEKNSSEHCEIQQQDPQTSSVIVKLEPDEDGDFAPAKKQSKGKKRARQGEAGELSKSKKVKLEEDADGVETETKPQKKKKIKKEEGNKKPKKEEGAIKAKKKTQEEKEAAAALKLKKKEEEEQMRWRWWEEEKYEDGIKWKFLEHEGPVFAPPYEPLPDSVKFYYDGKPLPLSLQAEEVASFFAKMLDHEYTTKEIFRNNYFMDWRKEMTLEERMVITDLAKCDFTEMFTYYKGKMEEKKNKSKEDKLKIKEENEKLLQEYGYCSMDHHRERIGNFKIEPPALFRGRGDHPKQGMLKKRILPEDIIINCSKDSKIPEPPPGHKWKEVRHDNTVTWLASWTENVQGSVKYIMLNANSKLKGEKDWEKYEVARKLKHHVVTIRKTYRENFKSKEMKVRQRAVALYFIDKLALRAGNEKEEGETADTVGCCSLRVEHIKLYPELDGDKYVVEFDFLGKDSIRYYNKVPVEKQVFKNLQLFMENKQEGDDLFDRLSTPLLNKHLQSLMEGLTAKVFRTYNASITLQQQLQELTDPEESMPSKILSYNRANRAVAILCNHQRAPPKTFDQSMANLKSKIDAKKEQILLAKKELKEAKKEAKEKESEKLNKVVESKKRGVQRAEEQLMRMEVQATDREENKQIALSTSKLNYLDPRISVAWCKKWTVGLEKIYNKTYRDKFAWAVDMTETDFIF